ncbi:protein of unknown function DUF164 [Coriobacterium glomerans PW2]|uniref:Uncharacterized protein n=1 Tax=Coriobacterium glomerans (strain ATCC 49209 / DSM 20642 / JCM 10262 / PW2) TaxID=700015 RepID=F2N9J7_CORGP|nr:C4-type zinc ribbon domain-containing protein [Coriobacterium glomerans]AEB07026.1 protein of unknown function DUF164 [Coriobacterium glomerans PW2]
MSVGQSLLQIQEIDLSLARERALLAEMPEFKDLARKRKAYLKLKNDAMKLFAQRKDIDIELADLDVDEKTTSAAVEAAQRNGVDPSNYHEVQNLELELTNLAKRLDKIKHARAENLEARASAVEKERALKDYIARFEASIIADTRQTRERAAQIQASIDEEQAERERIAASVPSELLDEYAEAMKRFDGLAIEHLDGVTPSICRTTLQPSSLADIRLQGEITRCPYCHRMLVHDRGGAQDA